MLYVHYSLKSLPFDVLNNAGVKDCVWATVKISDSDTLLVGVCYRSTSSDRVHNRELTDLIRKAGKIHSVTHLLIMGDFNYPEIHWDDHVVNAPEEADSQYFFNMIQDLYLVQHVSHTTRNRPGNTPSVLDLVFTNEEHMIDSVVHVAPLGKSDHDGLVFSFITGTPMDRNEITKKKLSYVKGDYKEMSKKFSEVNWQQELGNKLVGEAWSFFLNTVMKAVEQHVPL